MYDKWRFFLNYSISSALRILTHSYCLVSVLHKWYVDKNQSRKSILRNILKCITINPLGFNLQYDIQNFLSYFYYVNININNSKSISHSSNSSLKILLNASSFHLNFPLFQIKLSHVLKYSNTNTSWVKIIFKEDQQNLCTCIRSFSYLYSKTLFLNFGVDCCTCRIACVLFLSLLFMYCKRSVS